jgi:photosystem II stability/assembly factor-like uncharacterized protein
MRYALILCVLFAATTANAQWEIQSAPTTADLRGIHALGKGIAWASGSDGTVLRTTDDGAHWQLCPTPPGAEKLDFRGIQAFDEKTAIVMSTGKGPLSRLYKTTDACQTWKLVFTNPDPDGSWDAIRFRFDWVLNPTPNYGSGVLIGDPENGNYVIYTTENRGDTWHPWGPLEVAKPARAQSGESIFSASNSAAISPGVNGLFSFVTGGCGGSRLFFAQLHSPFDASTWWAFTISNLHISSNATSGAFSVAARFPARGLFADLMVVGGDYAKPESPGTAVYIPNRVPIRNLFSNPATRSEHPPHGFRSAVAYSPTTNTWITVGPNGTDISTDDGRNWRALRPTPNEPADADRDWNALSLPFVVGPHGRIGKLRPEALK